MKKKKKYNYNDDDEFIKLNKNINKYNKTIWKPDININFNKENINTCFDIYKATDNNNYNNIKFINVNKSSNELYRCIKVELKLNEYQKDIINRWFISFVLMYNQTLKYIKLRRTNNETQILDFKKLRTYHLKDIRNDIILNSQHPKYNKDTKIKTHILDKAIQLACSNYKSALTNLRNKNIKHFRIRYWKIKKDFYTLSIETSYFTKNSLCYNILGEVNAYYDNEKFDLGLIKTKYKSECKLNYNKLTNKYELIVPEKIKIKEDLDERKHFISLDPGIRTFMTGISNNDCIKINIDNDKIRKILLKIDNIKEINKYKKRRKNKLRIKLKNMIDELHHKTINYLTNNYDNILIGDLSVKGIVNNKTSNISKMNKRLAYSLSFFKFKERLKYKCQLKKCNYYEINEKYTSKLCSKCGTYKSDLGANSIYTCNNCDLIMDRDINGSRNICFKCIK